MTWIKRQFLRYNTKSTSIKKLDFIKMKSFCASKDTMKKVNTQPTYWKKICAHCLSDKEFVCRIQKDFFVTHNSIIEDKNPYF